MNVNGTRCNADSIHVGNVCPSCQAGISIGVEVVICNDCGSLQHAPCWDLHGCESYHCRGDSVEAKNLNPDFVIRKEELSSIVIPLPGRPGSTETIAREIQKTASATSPLSYVVSIIGFFVFLGAILLVSRTGRFTQVEGLGFFCILIGGIVSVILGGFTLATSPNRNRIFSNIPVVFGILAGAFSVGLSFVAVLVRSTEKDIDPVHFQANQVKDFISHAQGNIRGPLMSNVNISVDLGFSGESKGSGVILKIVEKKVYVISNLHVLTAGKAVSDLEALKISSKPLVTFHTGEKAPAKPVWIAPNGIDLAIVSADAPEKLEFSTRIQSDRPLSIGQKVFAIGNPMGLDWSYTEGVISGIRTQRFGEEEITVIQMQTPLNPGNSGGGLYDQDGYLIGINTWIYSKSLSEGLNFSLSIDSLFKVIDPALSNLLVQNSSKEKSGDQNVGQAEAPSGGLQQNH